MCFVDYEEYVKKKPQKNPTFQCDINTQRTIENHYLEANHFSMPMKSGTKLCSV